MAYVARRQNEDPYASPSQSLQQGAKQGSLGQERQQGTGVQGAQQQQGAQTSQSKPAGDFTRSNFTNANTILNRNRGADTSAITGRLTGNVDQEAANRTTALDNRGKEFVNTQRDAFTQSYAAPDAQALLRALGGDKDADNAVRTAAQRTGTDRIGEVGAEAGSLVPEEFFNANEFTPLLQRRAEGGYTSGMGALDQAVANREGIGQQVKTKVQGLQSGVAGKAKEVNALRDTVQGEADSYWKQQQDLLKGTIGSKANEIRGASEARVAPLQKQLTDKVNAQRAAQSSGLGKQVDAKLAEMRQLSQTLKSMGLDSRAIDENIAQLSGQADQGYDKFISGGVAPTVRAQDLVTGDEANQFNQLMGYIGSGESLTAGKTPVAQDAAVNGADFNKWLQGILGNDATSAQTLMAQEKAKAALRTPTTGDKQQKNAPIVRDSSGGSAGGVPTPKGPSINPNPNTGDDGGDPLENDPNSPNAGDTIYDPGTTDSPQRRGEAAPLGGGTPNQGGQKSGTINLQPDVKNVRDFFTGGKDKPAPKTPLEQYNEASTGWEAKRQKEVGPLLKKASGIGGTMLLTPAERAKLAAWEKANPQPTRKQYGMNEVQQGSYGVGGSKHLCGAMHALGHLPDAIYAADLAYAVTVLPTIKRGYTLWALPLSEVVRRRPLVARLCKPFVLAWANEMAGNSTRLGRFLKRFGEPACHVLGRVF